MNVVYAAISRCSSEALRHFHFTLLFHYSRGRALWLESANNGARDSHHPLYMSRNRVGNGWSKAPLNPSINTKPSLWVVPCPLFAPTPYVICGHDTPGTRVHAAEGEINPAASCEKWRWWSRRRGAWRADMKFTLHALRHVTGVWGEEWGSEYREGRTAYSKMGEY